MKEKRTFVGILLVAALLIMAQPSVSIGYNGPCPWVPNDDDIFAIELTDTEGIGSFYIYAWGEGPDASLKLVEDAEYEGRTVYFIKMFNHWYAGLTLGSLELSLGDTPQFGFYFSDGSILPSYNRKKGTDDYYILSNDKVEMAVAVHDVDPIPLPASALLLASGIVGLIAFSRVRRNS